MKRECGFTLVEIMVVVIFILLMVLPLMLIMMQSMRGIVYSKNRTEALLFTEARIERWKATPFDNITDRSNETISAGGINYTMNTTVNYTTYPYERKDVIVRTSWVEGGREHSVELGTRIHPY
jgi:Tfp pilus assembly protein PilV